MDERFDPGREVGKWTSLLLRLAVASLYAAAAAGKWVHGPAGARITADYFQSVFRETWLPPVLVTGHANVTFLVEPLLVLWLLTGWRLTLAWVVTTAFTVTLAFGMAVAGRHDVAAANFMYVLVGCAGLYVSPYDGFRLDRIGRLAGTGGPAGRT